MILFRIGPPKRTLGLGDISHLAQSAYFEGKRRGYTHIHLEWPDIVTAFNMMKITRPDESIYPIKFVDANDNEYEEIIDYRKNNSLHPDYLRIDSEGRKAFTTVLQWANYYYYTTEDRPVFNIPKDKLDKPYILFHYRGCKKSDIKNSTMKTTREVIEVINKYKDKGYELHKIGEPTQLDYIFDRVHPLYIDDVDRYWRAINNASVVIGNAQSGPVNYSDTFGIPTVRVDGLYKSSAAPYNEKVWSRYNCSGKTFIDWVEDDKKLVMYKESFNPELLTGFLDRWL